MDRHLYIAGSSKVELCKATNVAQIVNVDGEFSEKVDDLRSAIGQAKVQDQRRGGHGQDLLRKRLDLHLKQL